jgi:hypothetical protein
MKLEDIKKAVAKQQEENHRQETQVRRLQRELARQRAAELGLARQLDGTLPNKDEKNGEDDNAELLEELMSDDDDNGATLGASKQLFGKKRTRTKGRHKFDHSSFADMDTSFPGTHSLTAFCFNVTLSSCWLTTQVAISK